MANETMKTARPLAGAAWRLAMKRLWIPRGAFGRCHYCGGTDTYRSIEPAATQGRILWCFTCGAADNAVGNCETKRAKRCASTPTRRQPPVEALDLAARILAKYKR